VAFTAPATENASPRAAADPQDAHPSTGSTPNTSLTSLQDLREEIARLELDLDDTDGELVNLKAIIWHLLGQAEKINAKSELLETAVEAVAKVLEEAVVTKDGQPGAGELTVAQARQVAADLAQGRRLLFEIGSFTDRLLDANLKTIAATKMRAETKAKMAEQQAVMHFAELAGRITGIIWQMAPDDAWLDTYEGTLRREVFGPLGLELPKTEALP
jgi:chromosome segregation ATPase